MPKRGSHCTRKGRNKHGRTVCRKYSKGRSLGNGKTTMGRRRKHKRK